MNVVVEINDKLSHRDTHIASCETDREGLKARLEKQWRAYLRRYKPLQIPIRCEFCACRGGAVALPQSRLPAESHQRNAMERLLQVVAEFRAAHAAA